MDEPKTASVFESERMQELRNELNRQTYAYDEAMSLRQHMDSYVNSTDDEDEREELEATVLALAIPVEVLEAALTRVRSPQAGQLGETPKEVKKMSRPRRERRPARTPKFDMKAPDFGVEAPPEIGTVDEDSDE